MKRFSLIFLGALVSLVASCSKESKPHDPNEEPWVSDLNLPVPIEFGKSGFQFETKADMITQENFDKAPLRIFAVDLNDKGGLSPNPTGDKRVLFANEKAAYDASSKTIVFDGGKTWYYPYGSTHNYSFFAYHLGDYEPTISLASSTGDLYASIDLNKNQSDILLAQSIAEDYNGLKGYNAKYIRAIKTAKVESEYSPKLEFKHLTTALTFKFKIDPNDTETTEEKFVGVKVTELSLTNVPSIVNLWITDKTGVRPQLEDRLLTPTDGSPNGVNMNCDQIEAIPVNKEVTLGTLFVLIPKDRAEVEVAMKVSVPLSSGSETDEVPVKMKLRRDGDSFVAGRKYEYLITMKSPVDISIQAVLNDWENADIEKDDSFVVDQDGNNTGGLIIE